MEQKLIKFNQSMFPFLISLLFHLVVLGLFTLLPFTQPQVRFTEVVILLDPPIPSAIAQEDQVVDQPLVPIEEPAIIEEIAVPTVSQPEPTPITPTPPSPPSPVQPTPAPARPSQPTQSVARTTPQPVQQTPQSRMPTDDELLRDVQGLMPSRNQPTATTPVQTASPLTGFVTPQDSNQAEAEAQAFRQANPVTGPISQDVFTPVEQQRQTAPATDPTQALAALRAQMNQQYNQQTASPGTRTTQTAGFTDSRIQGDVGNRGLVSADRLNLSRHIQQRGTNWPGTITVRFEVDESGFSRILNESDFSLYSDLALAVFRLFVQDGQMFVAAPGTTRQQGSITFRLQ